MRRHTEGRRTAGRRRRRLASGILVAGALALCGMLLPAAASAATGAIAGKVTSTTGGPIAGASVCATPTEPGARKCTTTEASGKYKIEGLEPEEYEVEFRAAGYEDESITVPVGSGETVELDISLAPFGAISGRVTSGGAPIAEVEVCADFYFSCERTNANGEYTLEDLTAGSYVVSFQPPYTCSLLVCSSDYIFQYWNGKLSFETADRVNVVGGTTVTGVDAELQVGGHITGKVTNAASGAPIGSVEVCADPASETEGGCAYTNSAGEYTIIGLASGSYEVDFTGDVCGEVAKEVKCTHPFLAQFYQALVSVTAPNVTSGIDAALLERSNEKPVSTAAPTVSGTPRVGSMLSCSEGSWGNNPTSKTYQWLRNGVAIAGQTSALYTVQSADEGMGVSCQVTASNAAGSTAATSSAVQVPKPGVAVFVKASVKGAKASITLRCTGASPCAGVLKLIVKLSARGAHGKHKGKTRKLVIGTASFSIAVGKRVTLRVHLSGSGRKLLGRAHRRALRVQLSGTGVSVRTVGLKSKRK
jgi:Carboxypeptidase regulatory-like domain